LVATWAEGLFVCGDGTRSRELAGRSIRSLAADGDGALAIVEGHELRRRAANGTWSTIATSDAPLACCVGARGVIYVGTDDARVFRVDAHGAFQPLPGFDCVAGRERWYAGQTLVGGRLVGPPLGVRSLAVTADAAVLLANVHVGGIPRSVDGGATWRPTIDVDADVHEVRTHPTRAQVVAAAAAVGLCLSHDGGASWTIEREGLHASYCSAVAFAGDDVLVAAATDHFAPQAAVYRRPIDAAGPLTAIGGGFPERINGIADTACIGTRGSHVAIADRDGNLHVSADAGRTWAQHASGLPAPSSVLI
jgi:hypothetical protein